MAKLYIQQDTMYVQKMPYSEVCMHMRVAGKSMGVQLTGGQYPMAQLYERKSFGISPATNREIVKYVPFSAPVTTGEAGIYHDDDGYYIDNESCQFSFSPASAVVKGGD